MILCASGSRKFEIIEKSKSNRHIIKVLKSLCLHNGIPEVHHMEYWHHHGKTEVQSAAAQSGSSLLATELPWDHG